VDDPWGYGNSLEWATSCPPSRHNFTELPRIRSERPAFELHYPNMSQRMRAEAYVHPSLGKRMFGDTRQERGQRERGADTHIDTDEY
jgi:cytochrome c oxidase subunit 1